MTVYYTQDIAIHEPIVASCITVYMCAKSTTEKDCHHGKFYSCIEHQGMSLWVLKLFPIVVNDTV